MQSWPRNVLYLTSYILRQIAWMVENMIVLYLWISWCSTSFVCSFGLNHIVCDVIQLSWWPLSYIYDPVFHQYVWLWIVSNVTRGLLFPLGLENGLALSLFCYKAHTDWSFEIYHWSYPFHWLSNLLFYIYAWQKKKKREGSVLQEKMNAHHDGEQETTTINY